MKIIFLGDIVGKPGRRAVSEALPKWKKEHKPDLILANGENMAHGSGFTVSGFEEVQSAGVDFFTSGNHWARKHDGMALFSNSSKPIVRPANWVGDVPGVGYKVIEIGTTKVAIINLIGQIFMHEQHNSAFYKLDEVLDETGSNVKVVIVDFHAEVTSEKVALAWHADGRASLVVGTHTHVPTADARILPQGTGFVTDLGMCGGSGGVIGDDRALRVQQFLDQLPAKHEVQEEGPMQVNAIIAEIDTKTGKTTAIERLDEAVDMQ
jgi:2',3'-cyclic-nucleotide 2'-phosphodiesterase